MRKVEAVDIYKLYAQGSWRGWNEFLSECFDNSDTNRLARMRYALQAGMDDLVKKKMNTDALDKLYMRLLKSVEKTMKAILRKKYPNPLDNPLMDKDKEFGAKSKWLEIKRKRDHEFELFLRKSSY